MSSLINLLKNNKNKKKTESFKWSENTEKTFHKFKDVFTTVLILVHFDLDLKNQIKTDTLNYTVTEIYIQLQAFRQWNFITYWLCKLLSVKDSYKTHNLKFLVIVETFKQWCHYLKKSSHSIKILTDHNNLCEFMNVKMLNKRQTQWAVKLTVFDFVILHRLSKINFVNALLRCSNYIRVISESIDRFLSTLQRKLAVMSAIMFKFLMIISCFETVCQTCEEWIDIRSREFQLSWHILSEQNSEQSLIHQEHSVANVLNSAAETVNCRSLILHVLISELISHETTYSDSNEFFLLLICFLQEINTLVQAQKTKETKKKYSYDAECLRWIFNSIELLHYNKRMYISSETSVKAEILKSHYDDELMNYFNIEW